MSSTLAQRQSERRPPASRRRFAPVVAVFAGLAGFACASCTGWTAGGGAPAVVDEVDVLRPALAGTYRMVGTEHDSRTGATERIVETYVVEPGFSSGGVDHQITTLRDRSGRSERWETELRRAGAYRVRESANGASWDWTPPLRAVALPLRVGVSWRSASSATVPDVAGRRRVSQVRARATVVGTATVAVGGTRVFVFVIETTASTTVTDTARDTGKTSRFATRSKGRSWFAPSRLRVVRTEGTSAVRDGKAGGGEYFLTRRMEIERL